MLRTLLIATALLGASGTALAHGDYGYGRVIEVEPHIAISFGSPYPNGFRVLYESGGARYWTHTTYRPGPMIMLPPPVYRHMYHDRGYRHDWDDHKDWREARHENRHKNRHHDRD